MSLFYCYWMSLNHFATSKSFGKFGKLVSPEWLCDYLISRLSRLIFDKIRKLLPIYWLHASKYLCFTFTAARTFFNGFPAIQISDSTMLMQETLISFEEIMQTKLKVKLCISQSFTQSLYIAKESCFSSKERRLGDLTWVFQH